MRYCPPMIVPETKRAWSSESEVVWRADGREGVEVLPPRAESASGRGFEVSGSLRVFASAESSTRVPHEGHERLPSAISAVQEIHLMRRELYHLRTRLTGAARAPGPPPRGFNYARVGQKFKRRRGRGLLILELRGGGS